MNKSTNQIDFDRFKKVLDDLTDKNTNKDIAKNRGFKIVSNEVFTYGLDKFGLSPIYIKRALHDDCIHSSPIDL